MAAKFRQKSDEKDYYNAGPASYNTQTNFYKNRGVSFTKSKQRPDTSNETNRAPGSKGNQFLLAKKIKGKLFNFQHILICV